MSKVQMKKMERYGEMVRHSSEYLGQRYRQFQSDQRGVIAVVFAIMAALVVMLIGGSVDYGRWLSAKSKTMNAMDAAVLAGGRVLQIPGKTSADAIASAEKYYAKNKSNQLYADNVSFSVSNNAVIATSGASSVKTPFLKMAGISSMPVKLNSKAILAAGGGKSHFEIALMLDVTGSMGSGTKMQDLQDASKDLVDIVVWADQSEHTSRVALAPFSEYVNVSAEYFCQVAGPDACRIPVTTTEEVEVEKEVCKPKNGNNGHGNDDDGYDSSNPGQGKGKTADNTDQDGAPGNKGGSKDKDCKIETVKETRTITTYFDPTTKGDKYTCVKERDTSDRYKDTAPGDLNYFKYFGDTSSQKDHILDDNSACKPGATILPLTKDKTAIKARIDALPTTGRTAGHLGTQWAWYLLSPNWNSIWPTASQPKSYSMLSQTNPDGTKKLYKIAVLMTDGSYNEDYSGSSSTTQAREICTKMKNEGVTVYTVGFGISKDSTPDVTMQQCATTSSHYYNASNGEALKQAFRDIALKISDLRLAE